MEHQLTRALTSAVAGRKVRVGVIGTGFGRRVHIPAYKECPLTHIVAVCSSHEQRARDTARDFDIPYWFSDYRKMLADCTLDLVSIVTPPDLHLPMYLEALEHGVNVLCEKPLARNAQEALEMYEAGKNLPFISMLNLQLRFDPNRRKLKRLIDEGYVGTLHHVILQQLIGVYADQDSRSWDWWSDVDKGGGVVGGIGPHLLDTARWMFGDIVELSAHLATCVLERRHPTTGEMHSVETPDYSSALLTFDSGAEGIIAMSVVAWSGGGSRIEAYGSDGTLILDSFGRLWGAKRGDTRMTDISEISRDKPDSTAAHVGSLVKQLSDAIIGERQSVPEGGATFYDGLLVQELLDALRLSQNEKRRVRVSELARH